MNTFYCILNLNIRPEINERLSIGMLMVYGNKVWFNFSKNKLSTIKNLISNSTYKAALNYLKYIEKSVEGNRTINNSKDVLQLDDLNKYSRVFSESYLEYLSRYNSNLLSFSKPKELEIQPSDNIFEQLFSKLIDESAFLIEEKEINQIDLVKKNYYPQIKSYFSINKAIDSRKYTGLLTPIKLDLLGKNDIEVFGQSIDFEKSIKSLEHSVGSLIHLNSALPKSKQFVIGREPDKQQDINHRIWNNVRTFKAFQYLDISEVELITEYAKKHSVKPLFDLEIT